MVKIKVRRTRLFKVIALVLPVFLLACAELVLRLCGVGHDTSLFVRDPDNAAYYVMNPYASSIYFSDSINATKGNLERFPVRKAPGTLRIFVLGESTTAGYPYMHNGSFHRWLQYRLMHDLPDRDIEIINTSLTAVNSYTVLGFGRQLLDYEPDAVLIYTGHNEYYGALGVGSTSRIGSSRLFVKAVLWLRQLRLGQVLQRLIGGMHGSGSIYTRENLMQRMASKQMIPYGSKDFNAGLEQFQDNMEELCRWFAGRHIPVFLSTLVRNEKDQKPFISAPGDDPATAANAFRRAGSEWQMGHFEEAKRAYRMAADQDLLRFRAPDTLNTMIRQLAVRYSRDVHLVDARGIFEAHSPHGIPGGELLLEHVHPNLYGYALLSEAFYQSLLSAHIVTVSPDRAMSFDTLLARMPVTRVDSLYGAYQVMMLRTRWPFDEPLPPGYKRGDSFDEELAGAFAVGRITWLDAMDQLFKRCLKQGDNKGALQAVEATMLDHPENPTYLAYAGRLSFEISCPERGMTYFKRLYRMDPSEANARLLQLAEHKAAEKY